MGKSARGGGGGGGGGKWVSGDRWDRRWDGEAQAEVGGRGGIARCALRQKKSYMIKL